MGYLENYKAKLNATRPLLDVAQKSYILNFSKDASYKKTPMITPNGLIDTFEFHTLGKEKIALFPQKIAPAGSLFEMRNDTWMIFDVKASDDIVTVGKIAEINYKLKWMLEGKVEITAINVSDNLNQGIEDEDYIQIGSDKLVLLMPRNEKTEKLRRLRRLMIESVPYKIERILRFEFNGAFKMILAEDVLRKNDSEEVCDYYSDIEIVDPTSRIDGADFIRKGTFENYSLIIDDVTVSPNWTIEPSADSQITLEVNDGVAKISIGSSLSNVGKIINLNTEYGGLEYTKEIKVAALF